ncbi:class I SAM-dependent methyltransferase [Oceanithermus sp.]
MGIPFDRLGWLFARWGHRTYPEWAEPILRDWLAERPEGARIVDLGGGTGVLTRMARRFRPGLDYWVVDPAGGMLRYAPEGVRTLAARAEALPFQGASVDGVMIGEALHHFTDPQAALAEVARILRPGGGLWIYDFDPGRSVGRLVYWGERLVGEPANFFVPEALEAMLEELGFATRTHARRGRYVLTATASAERPQEAVPLG